MPLVISTWELWKASPFLPILFLPFTNAADEGRVARDPRNKSTHRGTKRKQTDVSSEASLVSQSQRRLACTSQGGIT